LSINNLAMGEMSRQVMMISCAHTVEAHWPVANSVFAELPASRAVPLALQPPGANAVHIHQENQQKNLNWLILT
jgi:hypothetical protein